MVPSLINKDMFEPGYNGLNFMVWNHNYICTNLIYMFFFKFFSIIGYCKITEYSSVFYTLELRDFDAVL